MNCSKCGKLCKFVPQYGLWWCEDCKGYLPPAAPPPQNKTNLGVAIGVPLGIVGGIMLLGILAAVAIPSFMSYQKKSKKGEAAEHLDEIYRSARAYYEVNAQLPQGKAGPTPEIGACCQELGMNRGKCSPDPLMWDRDPVWRDLDFSMYRSHYYSYEYEGTPTGFTVRAYGDLDCDMTTSTFELTGELFSGDLVKGPLDQVRPTE
jgi:type II secretory pathway pseudopilin PulG